MGFPGGFIGGFTLTASTLYLISAIHRRNREAQALSLSQQSLLLRQAIEPLQATPSVRRSLSRDPDAPEPRRTMGESAKEMWNGEVTRLVSWAQNKDWDATGRRIADGALNVYGRVSASVRQLAHDKSPEVRAATRREGNP